MVLGLRTDYSLSSDHPLRRSVVSKYRRLNSSLVGRSAGFSIALQAAVLLMHQVKLVATGLGRGRMKILLLGATGDARSASATRKVATLNPTNDGRLQNP
jgi:hypothetical protein